MGAGERESGRQGCAEIEMGQMQTGRGEALELQRAKQSRAAHTHTHIVSGSRI